MLLRIALQLRQNVLAETAVNDPLRGSVSHLGVTRTLSAKSLTSLAKLASDSSLRSNRLELIEQPS